MRIETLKKILKIGSRESKLAVAQAEEVKRLIQKNHPELTIEIVTMKTTGDKILSQSLELIGGKGLFVKELDHALRDGRIDIAVHSLKDVPMEIAEDLPLLAFSKREDPRDVLILREKERDLGDHPIIGTSSRRRKLQMQTLYKEAEFVGIRGNVQTRLRKLQEEGMDGTILAAAGLNRMQMAEVAARFFSVDEMIPAAGQGILAVQGKATKENLFYTACIDHRDSRYAALAERAFVRYLNGGCTSPVAAHAEVLEDEILIRGLYYEECTDSYFTDRIEGAPQEAERLGTELAKRMERDAQRERK